MNNKDRFNMNHDSQAYSHWELLGTVLWGSLIIVLYIVAQVASMVAWLAYQGRPMSDLATVGFNGSALSVAVIGSMVVSLIAIYIVIKLKKGSLLQDYLALKPFDLRILPKWIGVLMLMIGLSTALMYLTPGNQNEAFMVDVYLSAKPKWLLFLAVVLAAPIFEELFFRGFLFKGFEHSVLGLAGTLIITSASWAAIHMQYDYTYIMMIFALGIVLGLARYKTGTVWVPIILHALYNLVAMLETGFSV